MNSINILSWNIRGINNDISKRNLRELVYANKVDIIRLQESKCVDWPGGLKDQALNPDEFEVTSQPSVGFSGGLATLWCKSKLKCVSLAQCRYWIWTTFVLFQGEEKFHLVNIYSPLTIEQKRELWKEMELVFQCIGNEKVSLVGDFNCIRFVKDKWKCSFERKEAEEFNTFLTNRNLLEISPANADFTWFGPDGKKSRLDRVFS